MNKRKVGIGLTILLGSIISVSFANRNIKDTEPKVDVRDTFSLISINDAILSMAKTTDEEVEVEVNNISDEIEEEIIAEEDIQGSSEEVNKVQEKRGNISTASRGSTVTDNRIKTKKLSQHLNNYVLDVIKTYSLEDGNYPYLYNNDFENYNGVTEDLYYKGELLLKANPSGNKASHCTGITFEVFFKAMQERNKALGIPVDDFNGMTKDELLDFALNWYVALGTKSESNLSVAIEKYGLGDRITNLEDLMPGDFIDLSRENNTGHAVIFQNWIREGDKIIGLRHWSSQQSTKGISYKEEYFNIKGSNGKKYGNVMIDSLHMVRINPVNEYKKY